MEQAEIAEKPQTAAVDEVQQSSFQDPQKLPFWRKTAITAILACCTLSVTLCSSIFSSTLVVTAEEFKTTTEVMMLGVSLYVLGFAVGPLFWGMSPRAIVLTVLTSLLGPLSEFTGRKYPLFVGYALFGIIQIPTALVHDLGGLLFLRFLAGTTGAATMAIVTPIYADIWSPASRGTASAIYSIACFVGPCLGPITGIAIVEDERLGWRWTAWIFVIITATFGIPAFVIVPETYVIYLKGDAKPTLQVFVSKYLVRPAAMLRHELMLDVMTLYISLVYGIQYLTFFAIPHIFTHDRKWSAKSATLPFLSMLLGIITACIGVSIFWTKYYGPRLRARGGKVRPEDRLPPIMLGSLLMPTGLFWLAWTDNTHWFPQVMSLFFLGAGIMLIFAVGIVYIIDIYLPVSASAIAANTAIRSIVAAGLPMAAPRMYRTLGSPWATSLLAFLTAALIPAPFLFWKYGESLRKKSKFAIS
jgi:MFS transporter, DHA1 family, multidrug resistance protein